MIGADVGKIANARIRIKESRKFLTRQQVRTLNGQIRAGDIDGALLGLQKILSRNKGRSCEMSKT